MEAMNKPHKHKDLIIAWANGAEIERYSNEHNCWIKAHKPVWSEYSHYRIKPQPKLVPFDLEEDADKLIGKAVVNKESGNILLVIGVSKINKEVCIGDSWVSQELLLVRYAFLDGSPCGKYVEE